MSRTYLTFRVGQHLCGLDVAVVREVLRSGPFTPVPLAPAYVAGLINLRGQVVLALDLRTKLTLPDSEPAAMTCVLQHGGEPTAVLVDAIGDVVHVSDEPCTPPATLPASVRDLVAGTHTLEHDLLVVLDPAAVLAT